MSIHINGQLEVDADRGVIYFHNSTNGASTLRICGLKGQLIDFTVETQIDITMPIVMRSEMFRAVPRPKPPRPPTQKSPKVFFLNEQHTTHITRAQARRERAEYKKGKAKK